MGEPYSIGKTIIDLEDRILNPKYKMLIDMESMPIENRY